MVHVMATFIVKPNKLAEVREAIGRFIDAVRDNEPDCLLYESFQGEDDNSFVHLMSFEDEAAEARHNQTLHTRQFHELLEAVCNQGPIFAHLKLLRTTER
ncbi:MAG TPA: antibiotic biosynthesis monooxygenase [candidate division Zixibacteria bacterium]|nr:antibiotic biosynthesis monooxygenase [candidate division Zixibacteria bacterium]